MMGLLATAIPLALVSIMADEGLDLIAYPDSGGWSIGYGHFLGRIRPGPELMETGITQERATELLTRDLAISSRSVQDIFPVSHLGAGDADRLAVLIELVYQVGAHGARAFHHLRDCVRDEDWPGAAREILDSKLASQTPTRARRYADRLLEGTPMGEQGGLPK